MFSVPVNMEKVKTLEALTGKKPDMSMICVFGANYFKHVPKAKRSGKLGDRSIEGIIVGYRSVNFYRIWSQLEMVEEMRFQKMSALKKRTLLPLETERFQEKFLNRFQRGNDSR